jgi:hypothetical protein
VAVCGKPYEVCVQQVNPCFGHKMRYMRSHGSGVLRPGELWRTGTIREHQDDIVRRAKQNGYDPQPVGARWV